MRGEQEVARLALQARKRGVVIARHALQPGPLRPACRAAAIVVTMEMGNE